MMILLFFASALAAYCRIVLAPNHVVVEEPEDRDDDFVLANRYEMHCGTTESWISKNIIVDCPMCRTASDYSRSTILVAQHLVDYEAWERQYHTTVLIWFTVVLATMAISVNVFGTEPNATRRLIVNLMIVGTGCYVGYWYFQTTSELLA